MFVGGRCEDADVSAIVFALTASIIWGWADFLGGLYSRRMSALLVLLIGQSVGLVGALGIALALGVEAPDLRGIAGGVLAGAGTAVGLAAFYRALAVGTMSIVAPISALGAAVPVLVGFGLGESPSPVQGAGMAVAIAGVVLASRSSDGAHAGGSGGSGGVGLALLSALAIGFGLVGLDVAAESGVLWSVITTRAVAALLLALALAGTSAGRSLARRDLVSLALIGCLDAAAVGLLAQATTTGLVGVVSVLGSLYPVTTVVLAQLVLRERISRVQALGVATALAGVLLIAAG